MESGRGDGSLELDLPLTCATTMSTINVKIEFGGGLELLFSNQRSHSVAIPAEVPLSSKPADAETSTERKPADITYLMYWLRDNLLKEREELFIENGTVYVISNSLLE